MSEPPSYCVNQLDPIGLSAPIRKVRHTWKSLAHRGAVPTPLLGIVGALGGQSGDVLCGACAPASKFAWGATLGGNQAVTVLRRCRVGSGGGSHLGPVVEHMKLLYSM